MSEQHPSSANANSRRPRWQFSLGGLLGTVTTICIVLAVLAMETTQVEIAIDCLQMPPNDHALKAWLNRQSDLDAVQLRRKGDSVVLRYQRKNLRSSGDYVTPNFKEFGYQVSGMSFSHVSTYPALDGIWRFLQRTGVMWLFVLAVPISYVLYSRLWRK